jgi:hypothetical protein
MTDFTAGMGAGAYLQISMQEVGTSQAGNYSLVNWQLYLVCGNGQSWNADSTGWSATIAGQGFGGGYTFDFRGSSVKLIASGQVAVGHDANGYGSCYGSGYTAYTGTSIGGPTSVGGTIGLSRIPKPPSSPGISVASVVGRTVSITVTAPGDNGGSAITKYTVQYSLNGGGWTGSQYGGSTVYTDLAPGNYQFRAFATNAVGDGSAAVTGNVVVKAGGKVWTGSAWAADTPKVWTGSAWADATVKVWSGSTWAAAL